MRYYFLLFFLPLALFSQDDEITSLREDRTKVLRYGIDDEVVEVINAIKDEKDYSYNEELLAILTVTGNRKIQLPILLFFQNQKSDIAASYVSTILKEATEDYEVDEKVLLASISYSGTIENSQAVEYLYQLSQFNKPLIAAEAIRILGKIGDDTYAERFLERLQDDDFEDNESSLRESTILLLGELRYKPALLTLIDIAQDESASPVSRRYACDSLGKIGDEEAIPILEGILNDEDRILRSYALSSLAYFETDEIEAILIEALRDSFWRIRVAACEGLAKRKALSAIEILIYKAERDPEVNVKKAAMSALARIGGNTSWNFLAQYYEDQGNTDQLRSIAFNSLLAENVSQISESIKRVFEQEWEKDSSWLLNYTCKELSRIESEDLLWFYEKMLDHKNYLIRIYAVRGIALNDVLSLYGRVREIAEDDNENKQLRKEASSI